MAVVSSSSTLLVGVLTGLKGIHWLGSGVRACEAIIHKAIQGTGVCQASSEAAWVLRSVLCSRSLLEIRAMITGEHFGKSFHLVHAKDEAVSMISSGEEGVIEDSEMVNVRLIK